jgi:hypothetical protein
LLLITARNCPARRRFRKDSPTWFASCFVTALMLGLGFAASAQAGADEAWRIVQSAGDVRVSTEADATMVTLIRARSFPKAPS